MICLDFRGTQLRPCLGRRLSRRDLESDRLIELNARDRIQRLATFANNGHVLSGKWFNRITPGGRVFQVLIRGVGRQRLVDKPAEYAAFESIIEETLAKQPIRICSYCLMPNHWHFVLWPEGDGDLAAFMQRLTVTHVTRWQKNRRRVGEGHVPRSLEIVPRGN